MDGALSWGVISSNAGSESLILHFDGPTNIDDNFSARHEGWYVAPATTRYRFYVACDNQCQLHLDQAADGTSPSLIVEDLNQSTEKGQTINGLKSDWISLTKGSKYFLRGLMREAYNGDHFQAGVEIEATS